MTEHNILIVEDEAAIANVLILYCEQANFNVKHLDKGNDVIRYLKANTVDVILLDLMLPGVDGIALCQKIRQHSDVAIIMITAKSAEEDRLLGLELGADDYICKPFSPREVIARIKTLLRRIDAPLSKTIQRAGFALNRDCFEVSFHQTPIDLTPVEFKIFDVLLSSPNRVFSRNDLLNHAYSDSVDLVDRNIDTHIKNIRKKVKVIDTMTNPIKSVYGVGYKFTD